MTLPTKPDETPTYLYNPSKEDFIYPYALTDQIVPSRKLKVFPRYLADHLAKHLAQKLALEDDSKIHHEDKIKYWMDIIMAKV